MRGKTKAVIAAGVLVAVAAFGTYQYTHSDEYLARRAVAEATQAKATGQWSRAAERYADAALSNTAAAPAAQAGLKAMLDAAALAAQPPAQALGVIRQALRVNSGGVSVSRHADVVALGWSVIEAHGGADPASAKAVLDAIAPLDADKARIAAAAEALLDKIVAADPANMAAASELAELLERRRDCARCEALLAPHAAKLGQLEGARILGRLYAARGMLEESYKLLQPYTEQKLKRFTENEAAYRKSAEDIEKTSLERLREGKGPAAFYEKYKQSDDEGKRAMVGGYINDQISASPAMKRATQALRDSAAIVPAALDLGIVTVQRAQSMSEPAARNTQFQAAEKVFLAIKGVAGDSDNYRLYLGQVYYWLGKQDEGKRLFDELLQTHGRKFAVLLDVGSLLRSVGAVADGRALVEEAWRGAKDNEEKWQAAHTRSVMFVDAEDELAWLERSDPSNTRVRASLHNTRASLAQQKGQRTVAKREYELAAAEFAKLPESASQLNSAGLIHLALYGMEGDRNQLTQGLAKLDQALSLVPSDSILLLNNQSAVMSAAAAALVGDSIDLPALRSSGELGLTEYLHNDQATLDRLRQQVRDSEGVRKALAYGEKVALLAPRNPSAYGFSAQVHGYLEDNQAAQGLVERMRAAKLDLGDAERWIKDLADEKKVREQVEHMQASDKVSAALLQQQAVKRSPVTWTVAAGRWIDGRETLMRWGQPIDADEVVAVARKARSLQASAGTYSHLTKALEMRAAQRLAKANPAFAATVARHARLIDLSDLIVIQMDEDPEFLKLAQADADVREIVGLVRERESRYARRASAWAVMLFRNVDAAHADALAQQVRQDASHRIYVEMGEVYAPRHPETAVNRYFFELANGRRAQAVQALDEARRQGVALPELLGQRARKA
ncbi:MAG TPA: hypothetical protein VF169_06895 [Albitalea sp.]|uniref:tetratricopeptide repeat protein n=1 Tax=Piscinibacter sp. TaxID=1903157 RepID=UPI002ED1D8C3